MVLIGGTGRLLWAILRAFRIHDRTQFMGADCTNIVDPDTRIIELGAESDSGELVPQLPTDLLAGVRRALDESPTTEEGWARMLFIRGGTFTADYDPEADRTRWRSGVEALRSYFGREALGI